MPLNPDLILELLSSFDVLYQFIHYVAIALLLCDLMSWDNRILLVLPFPPFGLAAVLQDCGCSWL